MALIKQFNLFNFNTRTSELNKLQQDYEQRESNMTNQSQEIMQLKEACKNTEAKLAESQRDLTETRTKFQNSTVFIHHSCKANSLLKEEKDSLQKILQDNAFKLKNLKHDYDQINEKYLVIEQDYNNIHFENELLNKKINELKNLNELITNEKIESHKVLFKFIIGINYCFYLINPGLKEATTAKSELNNLQASAKTLNRKLNQTISDKDAKISQLQQTLIRIFFTYNVF